MLTLMQAMKTLTATIVLASVAIALTGCSGAPSLEQVADDCGGRSAGIHVDDSGLLVDLSYGSDALLCVLPKIMPDDSDQLAVTLAIDEGDATTLDIDGREVRVGTLGGSDFVFFGV